MFLSLNSNTTGATGEPGNSCHSGAHGLTLGFVWVSYFCWRYPISKKTKCPFQNTSGCLGIPIPQSLVFCIVLCRSLHVLLSLDMSCLSFECIVRLYGKKNIYCLQSNAFFFNFCLTGLPTSTTNWNKSQSNCKDQYSRVNHTTDMCELNEDTTKTGMWTNIFRVEISAHVDHGNSTNICI